MIFYILTIINIFLCVLAMFTLLNTLIKYSVPKRWAAYSIFQFTILIGTMLVLSYSWFYQPPEWKVRLTVTSIIISSALFFAWGLTFSSIRKK